jgi:hypothetical protein
VHGLRLGLRWTTQTEEPAGRYSRSPPSATVLATEACRTPSRLLRRTWECPLQLPVSYSLVSPSSRMAAITLAMCSSRSMPNISPPAPDTFVIDARSESGVAHFFLKDFGVERSAESEGGEGESCWKMGS